MAHSLLESDAATGVSQSFEPQCDFQVAVIGSFSGNIFVQIADVDSDLTNDNNWVNAHTASFTDTDRVKVFLASRGLAYRVNAANVGPRVIWSHITEASLYNVEGF